jgi:hypothetical protein
MKNLDKRIDNIFEGIDAKPSTATDMNNTWSLSHFMEHHITNDTLRVEHPTLGHGSVTSLNENTAHIDWDNLGSWTKHSGNITINEASVIIVTDFYKYLIEQTV